jgi:hypothetical protein
VCCQRLAPADLDSGPHTAAANVHTACAQEELKLEELDMSLEWDIDLVTCGLAWPDFLEDKLLGKQP